MKKLKTSEAELKTLEYPILLFSNNYLYQAASTVELVTHAKKPASVARDDKQRIVDSNCNLYDVQAWAETQVPLSWRSIPALILGSKFYLPVLGVSKKVTFDNLRSIIEELVVQGEMYNSYYDNEAQFRDGIEKCQDARDLFRLVRRLP